MKRSNIALFTLLLFALSMAFLLNANDTRREAFLRANQGELRIPELSTEDTYRLQGTWAFYPNAFIHEDSIEAKTYLEANQDWSTVLGSQQGFASYGLQLTNMNPDVIYGLLLEEAGNAHRIYVNEKLIMENGKPAKNALIYEPATYTSKAAFTSDEKGEAHIIIEVANFNGLKGGLIKAPLLGHLETIDFVYELTLMSEVFIFAGLLAVSIIFLFLHFIVNDVRSLYMAILSALVALRIATTGTHFIYMALPYFDLPLIWIIRIEYLSVFLMLPVMMLLVGTFSSFNYHEKVQRLLYVPIFLMPLLVSLSSEDILSKIFIAFQWVMVISGSYLIYLLAIGYRNQKVRIGRSIIIGLMIIVALLFGTYFSNLNNIMYLMLYIFVLFVGTTVMKRFSLIRSHSEKLETTAKIDPLTGLLNRSYLNALMENRDWIVSEGKYDVIFLDMNNFKEINDAHGHDIGDQVLRICAKRMRNSTHETDMIFRFGGDEFVIIAQLTESSNVQKMIKRIRDNFTEPIALNHLYLKISVAIGHEVFDSKTDDLKTVISNSDQRMYEDKRKLKFD